MDRRAAEVTGRLGGNDQAPPPAGKFLEQMVAFLCSDCGSPTCHFRHLTATRFLDGRPQTASDPLSRAAENCQSFSPGGAGRSRGGPGCSGILETKKEREGVWLFIFFVGETKLVLSRESSGERAEKYLPSLCLLPFSSPVVLISSSR